MARFTRVCTRGMVAVSGRRERYAGRRRMEPASAQPPDPPAAERSAEATASSRWERLSPRRRFRARLDRDPRRWVLFIVAMEGLVAAMVNDPEKIDYFLSPRYGALVLVFLVLLAVLPGLSILAMLVHGRIAFWTGRLLRGTARPHEIHAAFAWASAPFVAVGSPLLLEVPLRIAAIDRDPVPIWLARSIDIAARVRDPVEWAASIAAVVGLFLWVAYVAEAQRFSSWRAIANILITSALVLLSLIAIAIALWLAFEHGRGAVAYAAVGIAALGTGALLIARARRRRGFAA